MEINDMKTYKLYDCLNLYSTPESYYLQPTENESVLLHIDRVTEEMSLQTNNGQIPPLAEMQTIYGVLGRIRLVSGFYLVVITNRKHIGQVSGHDIWQIGDVDLIQFMKTSHYSNLKQDEWNNDYHSMLVSILSTSHLYYSYTYDITHTLQRLKATSPDFLNIPLFKRADPRFVWNGYLLDQFCITPDLHKFCVPIIHGFVSINSYTFEYEGINEKKTIRLALIARRSCRRAGTRLYRRGIDSDGNVANFVETEQIVEYDGAQNSFVQIRGSIPLFWHQYPNLKLKPKPTIIPDENHLEACSKHVEELTEKYGDVVMINLIDQRGPESKLQVKFKNVIEELQNKKIRYEAYDFHNECKNMKWDKLNALIDNLSNEQDRFNYFSMNKDRKTISLQEGIFRTNCIDCLNRTNVVQSLIAWRSLTLMLQQLELLNPNKPIKREVQFYRMFQNIWADHADYISIQYSGTGALKTDYTRTGQRTKRGALNDVANSLLRYYKNNLKDGFRQDSIDLLLGNYKIKVGEGVTEKCQLDTVRFRTYQTFVLLMAIAMLVSHIIFPSGNRPPLTQT
ncbi:phosphatidylinositol-3-phosphatase SAC1-like isoform X2 [Planococcus citri]|uniref:phosphatidylinositol-3-phosphatase SAC1-like isoform X2 n=1 Tax=Planococcus citri TaxID=170843 RepID=UPI0031FA4408